MDPMTTLPRTYGGIPAQCRAESSASLLAPYLRGYASHGSDPDGLPDARPVPTGIYHVHYRSSFAEPRSPRTYGGIPFCCA